MPELRTSPEGMTVYVPDGEVLDEYVHDRSEVAIIVGPIGSGSSTASCFRIFTTALEQHKDPRTGIRRSKWAIIRKTYPELLTSTVRTWLAWFPEETYGTLNRSRPMSQNIRIGDIELEVWFLALDGPEDIQKLRSVEFTGVWFNEVEFQSFEMFTEAKSRTGRYPREADGGSKWSGVIGDMNAPNEEHFIARMAGWAPYPDEIPLDKQLPWPAEWWLKKQPPALLEVKGPDGKVIEYVQNPRAENTKWLKVGYYLALARGATKRWIDSRLMNKVTFLTDGDPVWSNFDEEFHVARHALVYVAGLEVVVSCDFGRGRPCAIVSQEVGDRIHIQCEFRMYGVSASIFAPALKRFLTQHYAGARIRFTGDPKGQDRGQATELSSYDIFESHGMKVTPAPVRNNNLDDRLEAVSFALQTNRILVSPDKCLTLRAALAGKYVFEKLEKGEAKPLKDKYSDVADCLQYLCLFLGEGRRMVGLSAVMRHKPMQVAKRKSLRRVSA